MRNGSRGLALGLAAAACAAAVFTAPRNAGATTTRVWTLGVMNRFILDDANRWLWPHMITKYGHLFYVELYGFGDSLGATGDDSQRAGNDRTANGIVSDPKFIDGFFPTLTSADLMPVQSNAGGGAILALTDDLFIAFHLSDYENPLIKSFMEGPFADRAGGSPSMLGWLTGRSIEPLSNANRKFDVFAAYHVPDTASFGLLLTYGSSRYSREPNPNDAPLFENQARDEQARSNDHIGTSEFRFHLSGGLELGEEASIDVGLGLGLHGITYLPNNTDRLLDGGGGLDYQVDVRAMIGVSEMWEVVPAASLRGGSLFAADLGNFGSGLSYNNDPGRERVNETEVRVTWTMVDIGLAGHFKPADFVDFWGAIGWQMMRGNSQYEHPIGEDYGASPPLVRGACSGENGTEADCLEFAQLRGTADVLPYLRLGLEARVFSWLDLRGGVVKYLRSDSVFERKDDDQNNANNRDNTFTSDYPFFDYFVGFVAHYEGFFLDLQLDPEWFRRGPNFLSGAAGPMFVNASLGYRY